MGATLQAEATIYTTPGAQLPTISGTVATAVLHDADATWVAGATTLSDTEINGTLILRRGSVVTLRDVIVNGTIVSVTALMGPPYTSADATTLVIERGLRVESSPLLAGCSILLPDATLTLDATARIEVHGVMLANRMVLAGSGFLHSYVLAAAPLVVPASFDRPGWGRGPTAWPSTLETGAVGFATMAFRPHAVLSTEKKAIKGFKFTTAH